MKSTTTYPNSRLIIEELEVTENASTDHGNSSSSSFVNSPKSEVIVPKPNFPPTNNECVTCFFWNYVRIIVFYFMMYALKRELTGENVSIFKTAKTLYRIAKRKDRKCNML